ncbi:MAG: sulfatase [Sedimentisphaerales bacterium]|nr:sulfatase [Sedimentisphaerales bacterium]
MHTTITRRHFLHQTAAAGAAGFLGVSLQSCTSRSLVPQASDSSNRKPNILFIAVDDLRTQLGCYGHDETLSPNIDNLASEGVLFERAYCQMPACGPSRASLMTGIRPENNRFKSWRADQGAPEAVPLNQHFKSHGYQTVCNGKIFHSKTDSASGWSQAPWRVYDYDTQGRGDWGAVHFNKIWLDPDSQKHRSQTGRGPYHEKADLPDDAYEDGQVLNKSIEDMRGLSKSDKPFFLACGFHRPHLPFNAPKKYYDLYDPSTIELADNRYGLAHKPEDCRNSNEITRYSRIDGWPDREHFHRQARHAYYACVSYVDALIGRLLNELKTLGLDDNTIVVLWGDHGWLLGEHHFWGKHNTLNETLRVPLIIRAPGYQKNARTRALVELVDLYPTLCELAGLARPDSHQLEGRSVVPLLRSCHIEWKEAVFSEWAGGKAVKTDRYLYTEWANDKNMLFDHHLDPFENTNIAGKPENAELIKRLHALLNSV